MGFPNPIVVGNASASPGPSPPFQFGANLYQFLLNGTTHHVECYKSVDQGLTWTKKDGSNGPRTTSVYATVTDGTLFWIAYEDDFVTNNINLHTFDPATDTWGTDFPTTNDGFGALTSAAIIFRVVDSSIIFAFTPASLDIAGHVRCGYFTFNTVTHAFSAWIPFGQTDHVTPEQWNPYAIVQGNGCVHLLMLETDNDGAGPNYSMRQQSLSDVDVLGAIQIIDTATTSSPSDFPCGWGDGINVMFGWTTDPVTCTVKTFKGVSGLAPIALTEQDLSRGAGNLTTGDGLAILAKAGTFYALVLTINGTGINNFLTLFTDIGAGFDAGVLQGSVAVAVISFFAGRWANLLTFAAWGILLEASAYFWSAQAAPPPPVPSALGSIRLVTPLPIHLPDPRILCYHSRQKRCIFPDGRPIQLTKGVTGVYN